MATLQYSLSRIRNRRTGKSQVMMRLYHGRFNQRAKTGIFGYPEIWNKNSQRFEEQATFRHDGQMVTRREIISLNDHLDNLANEIMKTFIKKNVQKEEFPDKWLQDQIDSLTLNDKDQILKNDKPLYTKRIYISGKISGREEEARRQFTEAQRQLEDAGFLTVNPFGNGVKLDDTWERHLAVDITDLLECDAVCQLPGWRDSRGARLEYEVARLNGIPTLALEAFLMMGAPEEQEQGGTVRRRIRDLGKPLTQTDLSEETKSRLEQAGVRTFGDLLTFTRSELQALKELSRKNLSDIDALLIREHFEHIPFDIRFYGFDPSPSVHNEYTNTVEL